MQEKQKLYSSTEYKLCFSPFPLETEGDNGRTEAGDHHVRAKRRDCRKGVAAARDEARISLSIRYTNKKKVLYIMCCVLSQTRL